MNKELKVKIKESVYSVLPITLIVLLLNFTIAPMTSSMLGLFLIGAVLLILGMGLFTLGVDMSMMIIGEDIGAYITEKRKISLLLITTFIIGVIITIAEPDLQVLAAQIPSIPDKTIILSVSLGVGVFLVISILRTLFKIKLNYLLAILYSSIFILAAFVNKSFLSVAFDSGGVTTGPITVPFIMALGIGMANVRGDKFSEEDSFGLVGICSIGPILAVLIMGIFFNSSKINFSDISVNEVTNIQSLIVLFKNNIFIYLKEVAFALIPIIILFVVFQIFALKLKRKKVIKIGIGAIYTYLGLVLFLIGVKVGFMPAGNFIGKEIAMKPYNIILVPLGMLIGYFIILAEPAVHVLNKQVEEISGGAISGKVMNLGLSIGVSISIGIAMIRVITGISIWYFLIPGYLIAIVLTFFVPNIFTAVAFDSGGVASGPMTATFLLPFAMGACKAIGGNVLNDAFGIVAMVAMTPLISIQILGAIYNIKIKREMAKEESIVLEENDEIIDFDEEE